LHKSKRAQEKQDFSEKLPNMILTNSPVVAVKDSVKEGKVGKWSLPTLYIMLRVWLEKKIQIVCAVNPS
jgi:hypothetical protein